MSVLELLPATAPEVAATLGISVRHANARLQAQASKGRARRTDRLVRPLQKQRGRWPGLWEKIDGTLSSVLQSEDV